VIFARCELFIIYADRKLMAPAMSETHIHLPEERTEIQSHWHYQNTRRSHPAQRNNSDRREQTGNNGDLRNRPREQAHVRASQPIV